MGGERVSVPANVTNEPDTFGERSHICCIFTLSLCCCRLALIYLASQMIHRHSPGRERHRDGQTDERERERERGLTGKPILFSVWLNF